MKSIWLSEYGDASQQQESSKQRELPKDAHVVVIGGGISGILCAYLLKEQGIHAVILEAELCCSGQTGKTTAKITAQHGLIYHKLTESFGEETAGKYAYINQQAIDEYERIIRDKKIDCEYRRLSSYLYTNTDEGKKLLEWERTAAQKAGIPVSFVYDTGLPFAVKAALKFERQAQFHPLKFLYALLEELDVYEHTRVLRLNGQEVVTNRGVITAELIIIATHFPFLNIPGFYFSKMHQERSYVLAICPPMDADKDEWDLQGMYYGIDADALSFRNVGDMVLLGGKSHRTGENPKENPYTALRKEAAKLWPKYIEAGAWAAQDCITLDSMPYAGMFAKSRPTWYVATGFGKWGMTSSMVSAMAICDSVIGHKNSDMKILSPQRRFTRTAWKQLGEEMRISAKNLITFETPRCPHLGCHLIWNRYEKTWDCPCHGSRFHEDGNLIDNPAQKNLDRESSR